MTFAERYFSMGFLCCLCYFRLFYSESTFVFRNGKEINIKLNVDLARAVMKITSF